MKTTLKYAIAAGILFIVAFLFYHKVFIPKHTFSLYHPQKGDLKISRFGIGEVGAKDIYDVGFQTGGKLLEVLKEEGDHVSKGELLARIDPVDLPQKLKEADASLKRATLDKKALVEDQRGVQAKYELALKSYRRYRKLLKQGFVSQAEFDKISSDYNDAKAKLDSIKSRVSASDAVIEQLKESIEGIKKRLEILNIYSPVDGKITWKEAEAGESVPPAKPLFKIVDPKTLWVTTYIDERLSGAVKVGQSASILLRSHPDHPFKGRVVRIESMSDPITQEREVDVAFAEIPEPYYLLEQAEVTIDTGTLKDLWIVPLRYFATYKERRGIWIKQDGKAHFVVPKIAAKNEKYAGVKEGVDARMEIILPDPTKKPLSEGMRIYP
jgi:RND family efflux transporter MFP subunit